MIYQGETDSHKEILFKEKKATLLLLTYSQAYKMRGSL